MMLNRGANELRQVEVDELVSLLNEAQGLIADLRAKLSSTASERDALKDEVELLKGLAFDRTGENPFHHAPAAVSARLIATLSLAQRHEVWTRLLRQMSLAVSLSAIYPHDGGPDPLAILLVGSGGFGDALYCTPVIRELRLLFPDSRIVCFHSLPSITEVISLSPYTDHVFHLSNENIDT